MAFDFPASPSEGQVFAPVNGPLYVFRSGAWLIASIDSTPAQWVMVERIYSTAGTTPWTKSANLAYLEATVVGGGGGSGAAAATGAGQSSAGGGGGGGGTAIKLFAAADLPASVTVTVGAGGAAAGSGGNSTFNVLTGNGGGGTGAGSGAGSTLAFATRGGGGMSSGGGINIWGCSGEQGVRCVHGSAGSAYGGGGGGSHLAPTQPGAFTGIAASAGRFPGGGATGATNGASAGSVASGESGAVGVVILREYYPQWVIDAAYPPGTIRQTLALASGAYVKQAGLRFLEVICVGAGGGAPALAAQTAGNARTSSGGGGGGTSIKLYAASDLAASEPYTVGLGAINAAGNATTFKGQTGGGGNPGVTTSISTVSTPFFASGGVGAGASGGDINVYGGRGEMAQCCPSGVLVSIGGGGGGNFFVPPGGGTSKATTDAINGTFPGGGAISGAARGNEGTPTNAAAGGDGCIIFKEYF